MSILWAILLDWFVGEPTAKLHPVVWMGHYLRWVGHSLTRLAPWLAFSLGVLGWSVGAGLVYSFYWVLARWVEPWPAWAETFLVALLLKPLFSFRMLLGETRAVEQALKRDLDQGRSRLARIVSRDTHSLSESDVREAALESLSENLSDSLVAPLFWFLLLGLPGAALYRFANTADAMWGYRGQWEWAGKVAAQADDLLNWVPARLTAVVLWFWRPSIALKRLAGEARKTPSPNAGWPMATLALGLGIRLGKPGVYILNPVAPHPRTATFIAVSHGWFGLAGYGR